MFVVLCITLYRQFYTILETHNNTDDVPEFGNYLSTVYLVLTGKVITQIKEYTRPGDGLVQVFYLCKHNTSCMRFTLCVITVYAVVFFVFT